MFKRKDVAFEEAKHLDSLVRNQEEDYVRTAEDFGLSLESQEDITANVLPTLAYAQKHLHGHVMPIADMFIRIFPSKLTSFKLKLVKTFFAGEIKHLQKTKDYLEERLSPDTFVKHLKYLRFMFRYGASTENPKSDNPWTVPS